MSAATSKPRCGAIIWSELSRYQCSKSASLEHEGRHYCKTHHPPTLQARRKARSDAWQKRWDADRERQEKAKRELDEQKRQADCFPELLEALQMVQEAATEMRGSDFNLTTEQWAKFHAAISKALGEQQ